MKSFSTVAAGLAVLATSVVARQSPAFYLMALSDDDKINGTYFEAGHEGAAIEGLLVGTKHIKTKEAEYYTYKLNNTRANPDLGALSWVLHGGGFKESEPLLLYVDPSSNVALPLFEPGYEQNQFGFDKDDKLYIPYYVNDEVTPPKGGKSKKLYNWYTCETYFEGYVYTTLAWKLGRTGTPQNPSCQKVTVMREFK